MNLLGTLSLLVFCGFAAAISSCNTENTASTGLKPKGPRPEWGTSIHDAMLVLIEKLQSLPAQPIESLTPQQARQQPTLTDAVMAVVKENNIQMPAPMVDTMGRDIPVPGGSIHARIYTPKNTTGSLPVIVYYQGGGWVIADLDVYDASASAIAEKTGAVVVSVQYRKGPEFKFPTAHNDAFAAYKWVLQNAASFRADPARIAVLGESAGGNLACNVSIMARDNGVTMPLCQVLVYPVANNDLNAESVKKYANAKPLNKAMLEWFFSHYLNNMSESSDPRMKLVSANLAGLPNTTIINAEIDPLRDDGEALKNALKTAGVTVKHKLYAGVTHEFFGAAIVLPEAKDAQQVAVNALKSAWKDALATK